MNTDLNDRQAENNSRSMVGVGIGIGVVIGVALGTAMDNVGAGIGVTLDKQRNQNKK